MDILALGQVFSKYFCFPCQFSFHIHHLSSGAGTIGQLMADVSSGLTPPQETEKENQSSDKLPRFQIFLGSVFKSTAPRRNINGNFIV
jgi:hypothetical protein